MGRLRVGQVISLLLCLAFVASRCWGIRESCLWFDEIFSVHAAEHAWLDLLKFVSLDLIHPPLFYLILKLWIAVGGESLMWLRMLPAIIAGLSVIPFAGILRELRTSSTAFAISLFLLTVSGSLLKYSQEVRMYSLLLLLSTTSLWLFFRSLRTVRGLVILTVANILLVYTHYFGWLVISAEIVCVVLFARELAKRLILSQVAVLVAFVPWMIAIGAAASSGSDLGQNIGWMSRPGIRELAVLIFDLIEPFYSQAVSTQPHTLHIVTVPLLMLMLVAISVYCVDWKQREAEEKRQILVLSTLAGVPVLIALIASWVLPYSVWGTRHLIVVLCPLIIVIGKMVAGISNQGFRTGLIALLVLFCGYGGWLYATRGHVNLSWCVAEDIARQSAEDTQVKIYALEDLVAYHAWRGVRASGGAGGPVLKLEGVPETLEDKAYFLPRGFSDIPRLTIDDIPDREFRIIFRMRRWNHDDPLLVELRQRGFVIGEANVTNATDSDVITFLVTRPD